MSVGRFFQLLQLFPIALVKVVGGALAALLVAHDADLVKRSW